MSVGLYSMMGKTSRPPIVLDSVSKRFTLSLNRPRTLQEGFVRTLGVAGRKDPSRETFWAVRDVSFKVKQGEMLGLVGSNGSGKSTLLKLITRILTPTRGTVSVHGRVAALLELGTGFHPDLSGRENIYLNGSFMGLSRSDIRRRIDEVIAFADIGPFIDTPLRHYSSGMQVRLGFAVATMFDPDVLLVDEVLAVGDARFQASCLERIQELRQQGTTILFVSHDLSAVRKNCAEAVWLDQGQVRVIGPAHDTISAYMAKVWAENNVYVRPVLEDNTGRSKRWGSGEAEITDVRLVNQEGVNSATFETGDTMTIDLEYTAHKPLSRPVFGILIHGEDGMQIGESKNKGTEHWVEYLNGSGRIQCLLELPLLPAKYYLTVTVYDELLVHPYDHREQEFSFRVQASRFPEEHGRVRLQGRWGPPPLAPRTAAE